MKLVIKDAGSDNTGKHGTIAELNLYAAYGKADVQKAYNTYANYKSEDYTGKTWTFFADALANAKRYWITQTALQQHIPRHTQT